MYTAQHASFSARACAAKLAVDRIHVRDGHAFTLATKQGGCYVQSPTQATMRLFENSKQQVRVGRPRRAPLLRAPTSWRVI
jgi:hypothetical protein